MPTDCTVCPQFSNRLPSYVPIHASLILCYALLFSALVEEMKSYEYYRSFPRHLYARLLIRMFLSFGPLTVMC